MHEFHDEQFQTLYIDQLARPKATCHFKYTMHFYTLYVKQTWIFIPDLDIIRAVIRKIPYCKLYVSPEK